jgi:hypothetical protein
MNRDRPKIRSVALLVLALSLSCSASSSDVRVPPDESLTPVEYEELGLPDLEPDWNSEERTKARSLLRRLAAERPNQLPRFASDLSGAVFAKLVHEEFDRRAEFEGTIGQLSGRELEQLDPDELARLVQGDSLEGIYGLESTGGLLFDRELVELTAQRLGEALALRTDLEANLAHVRASPELATPEKDFTARYTEMLQINDQVLVQLLSNLAAFAIAERFTSVARSDAASHLVEQIPQIAPMLSAEAHADLREIISEAGATPGADPQLAALLGRL